MDKSKKLMILLIIIGIVVIGVVVALSYGAGTTLIAQPKNPPQSELNRIPDIVQQQYPCKFEWICSPIASDGKCDFGQVPLGQSLSKPAFRLTNQSNQTSCSYAVSINQTPYYCNETSLNCNYTLAPNEVRDIFINFRPGYYGRITSHVYIDSLQGQNGAYTVTGIGTTN